MKIKILKIGGFLILFFIAILIAFTYNIFSKHKKLGNSELLGEVTIDTIPFKMTQRGHILIDVKIEGSQETFPFILDSGAPNMIFGNDDEKFHFEQDGWGFGQGANGDFFFSPIIEIEKLKIGNIVFSNLHSLKSDLDFDCMHKIYGIIGIGVMRNLVWQFDFQKKIILVSEKLEDIQIRKESIKIPLSENRISHHLKTFVELENTDELVEVFIDLGSNGIISIKEDQFLQGGFTFPSKKIMGVGSEALGDNEDEKFNEKFYLIPKLSFNSSTYVLKNIPAHSTPSSLNLLGTGFFKHYKTTISWNDKLLILEPRQDIQNFIWKTAGFAAQYDQETNKVIITAIFQETPAAKENLPLGGEILLINNIAFTNKAAHCAFDYRNDSIDTLEILVEAKNEIKKYTIVKEPIF